MENYFSKNLKSIREFKKISQQDIAEKMNIDRSTIGYWENGKADPTMANVLKLADVLNVDIITLIGGELEFIDGEIINKSNYSQLKQETINEVVSLFKDKGFIDEQGNVKNEAKDLIDLAVKINKMVEKKNED